MSSDSECSADAEKQQGNQDDVLKILITTDNHLGFMEKDPERGEDSYIAFEEALQIAEREQVDFILLGGDLFHENKPTRDCLARCQSLLRKYCFGIKPIDFSIISDEHVNFGHTGFPYANFNDPNLNVSIPVFSIHGNHDDPTGAQNLCALDILASAGLVNYFGKCNTNMQNDVQINPVLIEKGETKLAIFGLGAIKDERLHHLFEKGMVRVNKPADSVEEQKRDWFNLFVIHQNRTAHGKKNYIPETFLEDFLDLVLWGHEHENRLKPEYNELKEFYVTQPGSTVITALCESEACPKAVGLLKINKKNFNLKEIQLTSTRPFLLDQIALKSCGISKTDKNLELKIQQVCAKKVEEMIAEANAGRSDSLKPMKPLIRLKVDYTDYDLINEARFAQKFVDKVANPRNILQFFRKQNTEKVDVTLDPEASKFLGAKYMEHIRVEDLVMKYFKEADEKNQLLCLTERGLSDAIKEYIEKDEKDAIMELVNFQIKKTQAYLKGNVNLNETQLDDEIRKFRRMRIAAEKEEEGEIKEIFNKVSQKSVKVKQECGSDNEVMGDDAEEDEEEFVKKSSVLKTKSKPKAKASAVNKDDDEDDDEEYGVRKVKSEKMDFDEELTLTSGTGRGRGGGRGSRGGRGRGRGAASKAAPPAAKKQTQLELTNFMAKQEPVTQQQRSQRSQQATPVIISDSDDSDLEILPPSKPSTTKTSVTVKQEPLTTRTNNVTRSAQKSTQQTGGGANATANTQRKILYEDDSDNEHSQQVTFDASKTTRQKTKKNENSDDDDEDFNIFKRVNNPKRRKI